MNASKTSPVQVASISEMNTRTDYCVFGDNKESYSKEIAKILKREQGAYRVIRIRDVNGKASFDVRSTFYGPSGSGREGHSVYVLQANGNLKRGY